MSLNKGDVEKIPADSHVRMTLKDQFGGTSFEGTFGGLEKGEEVRLKEGVRVDVDTVEQIEVQQ